MAKKVWEPFSNESEAFGLLQQKFIKTGLKHIIHKGF